MHPNELLARKEIELIQAGDWVVLPMPASYALARTSGAPVPRIFRGSATAIRTRRARARARARTKPLVRSARALNDQADASSMFFVTTSMVRPSSSVGLNSTTSVPAYRIGVCPGPTK
jgi:hypothetical protein